MGDIFFEGNLIARDLAHAVELYDKAAAVGIESAKKKSGELKAKREMFYKYAKEAEYLDPAQCFRNSAISTAMGYVPAMKLLAHLYEVGNGTKKDRQRAFMWYNSAFKAGDQSAAYEVGRCYAYGIGTAFDYKKAKQHLEIALEAGYTEAKREIDRLVANRNTRISEKSFSTAMRLLYSKKFEAAKGYLDLCVSLGNPKAIYTLGCLHEFGVGVHVDKDYAFSLYEDAYRLKFRDPRAVYKLRVLKMVR
jgi:TPR repeat protein